MSDDIRDAQKEFIETYDVLGRFLERHEKSVSEFLEGQNNIVKGEKDRKIVKVLHYRDDEKYDLYDGEFILETKRSN